MKELYETKISDARWWVCDIFGNIGWIMFGMCAVRRLGQELSMLSLAAFVPVMLMLVGIIELISEKIA